MRGLIAVLVLSWAGVGILCSQWSDFNLLIFSLGVLLLLVAVVVGGCWVNSMTGGDDEFHSDSFID